MAALCTGEREYTRFLNIELARTFPTEVDAGASDGRDVFACQMQTAARAAPSDWRKAALPTQDCSGRAVLLGPLCDSLRSVPPHSAADDVVVVHLALQVIVPARIGATGGCDGGCGRRSQANANTNYDWFNGGEAANALANLDGWNR